MIIKSYFSCPFLPTTEVEEHEVPEELQNASREELEEYAEELAKQLCMDIMADISVSCEIEEE